MRHFLGIAKHFKDVKNDSLLLTVNSAYKSKWGARSAVPDLYKGDATREWVSQCIQRLLNGYSVIILENDNMNHFSWAVDKIKNAAKANSIAIIENMTSILAKNLSHSPIIENFNGISFVGDVHGNFDKCKKVIDAATKHNSLLCFVGDIVNGGTNNIEVLNKIYELVVNKKALFLTGNNDAREYKGLRSKGYIPKKKNNSLFYEVENDEEKKIMVKAKLSYLIHSSPVIFDYTVNNTRYVSCHAGIHANYWAWGNNQKTRFHAIYGGEGSEDGQTFIPTEKNWLDLVPQNVKVIIGHHPQNGIPSIYNNVSGGSVIFLDTNVKNGGPLSSLEVTKSALEYFQIWN